MKLATMSQAPTLVEVGDRKYWVGPLRYRELGVLDRYLEERCLSPLKLAEAEAEALGIAGEDREAMLAEARKASRGWRRPEVGEDYRWVDVMLGSVDGVVFFLNVLFSKHQDFTADDLEYVMARVGPKQIRPLFLIAMEQPPEPEPEEANGDVPKDDVVASIT